MSRSLQIYNQVKGAGQIQFTSVCDVDARHLGRATSLLKEDGYDYVADWVIDDQPVWLKTRSKPILNIPYTQECNDVAMMLIQHHKASEYRDRALDQFEQIYADAKDSARVMALVLHPYIMGAPHRLKYFRAAIETIRRKPDVLFWTGAQILDWFLQVGPKS